MTKAVLVSHVAAKTSTTWAAAERMVGAAFSAIVDALSRDEAVATAGFGKFAVRGRAARQGRNPRTGEPVAIPASKVPSFKPAKAPSRRGQRIARWGRRPHPRHPFPQYGRHRAYPRNADLQNLASGIPSVPNALSVAGHRTAVHPHSAGYATFVAGRRCRYVADRSRLRTPAQSRTEIESARAGSWYGVRARCQISPATVLRVVALQTKRTHFLAACSRNHSQTQHHIRETVRSARAFYTPIPHCLYPARTPEPSLAPNANRGMERAILVLATRTRKSKCNLRWAMRTDQGAKARVSLV